MRRIGFSLLGIFVFVGALVVGVLVHLRTPVAHRVAEQRVTALLATLFAGTLALDGLQDVTLLGVTNAHATASDPEGVRVISVDHLDVEVSMVQLLREVTRGDAMVLDRVHLSNADVNLDSDSGGRSRLAQTFQPKSRGAPSSTPSRVQFRIDHIEVDHVWVHGVVGGRIIDGDVTDLDGILRVDGGHAEVGLETATLVTRAMPRDSNPAGRARARLVVDDVLHFGALFDGAVGGFPTRARGTIDDDALTAVLDIPKLDEAHARALVPEAPIHDDLSAHVEASGTVKAVGFAGLVTVGHGQLRANGKWVAPSIDAHVAWRDVEVRSFATTAPPLSVNGDFDIHANGSDVKAEGRTTTPGITLDVKASLEGDKLDAHATGTISSLGPIVASASPSTQLRGAGSLSANARLDLTTRLVDATVTGAFTNLSTSGIDAHALTFAGSARGPLASAALTIDARGFGLKRADLTLDELDATLDGSTDDARVTVHAVGKGDLDLSGRVARRGGGLSVDDLRILGAGAPVVGHARWTEGHGKVVLSCSDLDLARLHTLLSMETPLYGDVALDADIDITRQSVNGALTADVVALEYEEIHGGGLHLELSAGDDWSLLLKAHEATSGWVAVDANQVRPSGSPFALSSWRAATGHVRVAGQASLLALRRFAPSLEPVAGDVRLGATVSRTDPSVLPDVVVEASTTGLSAVVSGDQSVSGIDVFATAHLSPDGAFVAHVLGRDVREMVAEADLDARIDYAGAWRGEPIVPMLKATAFHLDARVPLHDARPICLFMGSTCDGEVEIFARAFGTVAAPRGFVHGRLNGFRGELSPAFGPMDALFETTYDGDRIEAGLHATTAEAQSLDAHTTLTHPSRDWTASGVALLHDFPLRLPGQAEAGRVRARVNGAVKLDDLHRDARLRADLKLDDIVAQGTPLGHADVNGGFDGNALLMTVHMRQPDGDADIVARAAATWGDKMVPSLNDNAPSTLTARAHNLSLKSAQGFVSDQLEEVDGRLNADLSASLSQGSKLAFQGWAKLKQGSAHSTSFGQLNDISADLTVQNDGTIRLDNGHAHGMTGELTVGAVAHVANGVIQDISIGPQIMPEAAFPIIVDGEHFADVYGNAKIVIKPQGTGWSVDTSLPSMHLILPDSSAHTVQKLDKNVKVEIGARGAHGFAPVATTMPQKAVIAKSGSSPLHLIVRLGDDVEIRQGTMVSVFVTGSPTIDIGEAIKVNGQIRVVKGKLEVEGKSFDIDQGTVTFAGDPQNPIVVVTASWLAPDGTEVFADFTGPLQSGKVTLRSEPSRAHNEIVALLVFGSADGPNSGGPSTDTQTKALGAGASYIAQPVNKALDQLTHAAIVTRVDTTSQSPKPEVEVQIARNISAMVSVVLGVPSPTDAPDVYWLTLAWRLKARWTVEAKVGDRGTSILDLFWRFRY